jgi:hypothetical protein
MESSRDFTINSRLEWKEKTEQKRILSLRDKKKNLNFSPRPITSPTKNPDPKSESDMTTNLKNLKTRIAVRKNKLSQGQSIECDKPRLKRINSI